MSFIEKYNELTKGTGKFTGVDRDLVEIYITRPLATCLLMFCKNFACSPNSITVISILPSLIGSILIIWANQNSFLRCIGVFLIFFCLVLDSLDGQFARYTKQGSEFGKWFDGLADNIRYIFIIITLSAGFYYYLDFSNQLWVGRFPFLMEHKELILIMALWIMANFYMIYYILATRGYLSFDTGPMLRVNPKNPDHKFFIGAESTLYIIFLSFLIFNQIYWLFVFLSLTTPIFWLLPLLKIYRASKIKK